MTEASKAITKLRQDLVMNKSEFARLLDVSNSAITQYEAGDRLPRHSVIRRMLTIAKENNLELDALQLIGG